MLSALFLNVFKNRTLNYFGHSQRLSCNRISFMSLHMFLIGNIPQSDLLVSVHSRYVGKPTSSFQNILYALPIYNFEHFFELFKSNHLPTISSSLFGGHKCFQQFYCQELCTWLYIFSFLFKMNCLSFIFNIIFFFITFFLFFLNLFLFCYYFIILLISITFFLFSFVWLLEIFVFLSLNFFLFLFLFFFLFHFLFF